MDCVRCSNVLLGAEQKVAIFVENNNLMAKKAAQNKILLWLSRGLLTNGKQLIVQS